MVTLNGLHFLGAVLVVWWLDYLRMRHNQRGGRRL